MRAANSHFLISGQTSPNLTITIQASPDLLTSFSNIGTASADTNGVFQFDDTGCR
jgi:hypothetical protein